MRAYLLSLPVPIAAAAFQLPDGLSGGSLPAWVVAFFTGIFVTVGVLEKLGKLPGASDGDRRKNVFTEDDRKALLAVEKSVTDSADQIRRTHDAVAYKDMDGVPRFVAHVKQTRDMCELMERVVALLEASERRGDDGFRIMAEALKQINAKLDVLAIGRIA